MGHFKEIAIACINVFSISKNSAYRVDVPYVSEYVMTIFQTLWIEPSFRVNLLFGDVQAGPEQNSFSKSTVDLGPKIHPRLCILILFDFMFDAFPRMMDDINLLLTTTYCRRHAHMAI